MRDGTFFFESSFKCNSDRNISIFQWNVIGHVRERGCTSDSPQLLKRRKKSRVIYKSQLQSAVHVTLCFVFHLVLILSFGFPPFFMRKNRVRDKANFTKGDVALSRAKRFYFFWVCPKEIKKMGSWETLVFCHLRCFGSVQWLELSKQRLLPVFLCLVFSVLCKGMNKRNNLSLDQFVFLCLSWVSVLKTTVFLNKNKLGLFTSV